MIYEPLDSCFDLIRSHQQCLPWSSPLKIESVTTECRAETLPLSYQSALQTSDAKLTSHGERLVWEIVVYTANKFETAVQWFRMSHAGICRISGHGNSLYNIIPLLKKENVHLFPCPWGYNNYTDTYFQSSWEDVPLEMTVSSVKGKDVTYKTHSALMTAQLPS